MKILETIRLQRSGLSQREIARSLKCSRNTVANLLKKFSALDKSYEELDELTDDEIRHLFYPSVSTLHRKSAPDWEEIALRLEKRPKLNLQYLWEEWRHLNPDGLSYSQFCERYRNWRKEQGLDTKMVQRRKPGFELFVDWSGDKLECLIDPLTGEIIPAYLFVATLGDSGYPFAKAYPNMRQISWNDGHISAFRYLGALPTIIVPDNCKTAVKSPSYYDPDINAAYADLARHYDVAVVPARAGKPTDKPVVEQSVGWLQTWLGEYLSSAAPFFSLEELNKSIEKRLAHLITRPYQKRAGSRLDVFEEVDRPALRPLPPLEYLKCESVRRTVGNNYHVSFEKIHYSVPYTYFGQKVLMKIGANHVEILDSTHRRIAYHLRSHDPIRNRYVTDPRHMPSHHKYVYEMSTRDGNWYKRQAKCIGPNVAKVIEALLTRQRFEQCAYKSCQAILSLSTKYEVKDLEKACAIALDAGKLSIAHITSLCKRECRLQDSQPIKHENLRDAQSFF